MLAGGVFEVCAGGVTDVSNVICRRCV